MQNPNHFSTDEVHPDPGLDWVMGLEPVMLGGLRQWLTLEGNVHGPLLVYLHGGPGAAELAVAKRFQAPLLPHWRVVNWDQRGSGKTVGKQVSLERLITDTHELVARLRQQHPG